MSAVVNSPASCSPRVGNVNVGGARCRLGLRRRPWRCGRPGGGERWRVVNAGRGGARSVGCGISWQAMLEPRLVAAREPRRRAVRFAGYVAVIATLGDALAGRLEGLMTSADSKSMWLRCGMDC